MYQQVWAGIDIGGTKTAVALSTEPPRILERFSFPTNPQSGPGPALERLIETLKTLLASQGFTSRDLRAIGISCGGPLDPIGGTIDAPPNLSTWGHVPITSILQAQFGVSCRLENDANAGALAEHRFGAGMQSKNMIFLTFGTGLGAGLILDGRLYRGTSFSAGEIGHIRLTRAGPIGFFKRGSAEGWASGGGIAQQAALSIRQAVRRGTDTLLNRARRPEEAAITAKDVWEAAQQNDPLACSIIKQSGRKLGEAIAILIDLFNPECIVVGGLAMRMGDAILGPAREMARRESIPGSFRDCRIVPAGLGESIGDLAALCVAMEGGEIHE